MEFLSQTGWFQQSDVQFLIRKENIQSNPTFKIHGDWTAQFEFLFQLRQFQNVSISVNVETYKLVVLVTLIARDKWTNVATDKRVSDTHYTAIVSRANRVYGLISELVLPLLRLLLTGDDFLKPSGIAFISLLLQVFPTTSSIVPK